MKHSDDAFTAGATWYTMHAISICFESGENHLSLARLKLLKHWPFALASARHNFEKGSNIRAKRKILWTRPSKSIQKHHNEIYFLGWIGQDYAIG